MTTIAQLRLSGEGVACRGAFERCPGLECELEPVVAGGIGLRVTGAEPGAVETALAADPTVTNHERIPGLVVWGRVRGRFGEPIGIVGDAGGTVLDASRARRASGRSGSGSSLARTASSARSFGSRIRPSATVAGLRPDGDPPSADDVGPYGGR